MWLLSFNIQLNIMWVVGFQASFHILFSTNHVRPTLSYLKSKHYSIKPQSIILRIIIVWMFMNRTSSGSTSSGKHQITKNVYFGKNILEILITRLFFVAYPHFPVCCPWLCKNILCSGPLMHQKDTGISNWQQFCGVWPTDISTNKRHSYGN